MNTDQWSHGDAHAAMRSGGWSEPVGYGEGPARDVSEAGGAIDFGAHAANLHALLKHNRKDEK